MRTHTFISTRFYRMFVCVYVCIWVYMSVYGAFQRNHRLTPSLTCSNAVPLATHATMRISFSTASTIFPLPSTMRARTHWPLSTSRFETERDIKTHAYTQTSIHVHANNVIFQLSCQDCWQSSLLDIIINNYQFNDTRGPLFL